MPTDQQALLDLRGLSAGYGDKRVLQGVDLSVQPGEIVAVIGRNGVGKTTLMKAIIGILKRTAGDLRFEGKDIGGVAPHRRARLGIGYIPQGREVFPRMSVRENLKVGEMLARPGQAPDYDRVYGFFPILRERAIQRAGTLSGGQQQQLAIGRALIGNPKLMLLDEPSEGIQPNIVKEIAHHIRTLNSELGVTVLFVEQNLDMIMSMAQRCYVMDKGRIVGELRPEQLHDREMVRRTLAV